MLKKAAVIDLGTNTFHLIIGTRSSDGLFNIIYRERNYVFLGRGGVNQIKEDRYIAGIEVLKRFRASIDLHDVDTIKILGTSALRSASNGPQFVAEAKSLTGFDIEVIDGLKEAEYIFKGVLLAKKPDDLHHLVMDIGGGSIEFILFQKQRLIWSKSFKIGISVLYPMFQRNDPLSNTDINDLQIHLDRTLIELSEILKNYKIESLVGASGSFEVLNKLNNGIQNQNCIDIDLTFFKTIFDQIMKMDLNERLSMPRLDPQRASLIQISLYLIDYVLNLSKAKKIVLSNFAMKEGALNELLS